MPEKEKAEKEKAEDGKLFQDSPLNSSNYHLFYLPRSVIPIKSGNAAGTFIRRLADITSRPHPHHLKKLSEICIRTSYDSYVI